jgi:hypothetical protein
VVQAVNDPVGVVAASGLVDRLDDEVIEEELRPQEPVREVEGS